MIKKQFLGFLFRWLVSSAGMWICINWFAKFDDPSVNGFWLYVVAGLVFSLVNSLVRPITTIFSLPLIIITMGIFTFIINIAMMALTFQILPGVSIEFMNAAFATITMSVINGLVNLALLAKPSKKVKA